MVNNRAKHRNPKGAAGARRRGKPPAERPLTAQQQRFAEELAKGDCSQKEAAERAGYSGSNAAAQASELVDNPNVEARIKELRAAAALEALISAEKVILEWGRLGFSDIRGVAEVIERGVNVFPSAEWSDDAARAVKKISQRMTEYGVNIDVEMHPKQPSLDSLGKYLGLLVDRSKVEHTGKDGGPIESKVLTLERADEIKRMILGLQRRVEDEDEKK